MKIKKPAFYVAAFDTRFLPATKALTKELLSVVDKHLIHHASEDSIAEGIGKLIFASGQAGPDWQEHRTCGC